MPSLEKHIFAVIKGSAADKIKFCMEKNPSDIRQITFESDIHIEFSEAVESLVLMLDCILPNSVPSKTILWDDVFKNNIAFVSVKWTGENESSRKHFSTKDIIESSAVCCGRILPNCGVLHNAVESEVQRDDTHAVSPNFDDNELSIALDDFVWNDTIIPPVLGNKLIASIDTF